MVKIMENHYFLMDDLGGTPLFLETPIYFGSTFSPIIMVQWKMANYLKGNDPIGYKPIFD